MAAVSDDNGLQLIEDLLHIDVISVKLDRLEALRGPGGVEPSDVLSILEKRSDLLLKLSAKLLRAQQYDDDGSLSRRSSLSEHSDSSGVVDGDDYCSFSDLEDGVPEVKLESSEETEISTSFYNELFPTVEVTQKSHLAGSFPDYEEFGPMHCIGSGAYGRAFKSTLNGVPVVLKASKTKSEAANRADYQEWSVSDRLKRHPNVLQVTGLCPSFKHPFYTEMGSTAIISPWQDGGGLREFYDKRSPNPNDLQNAAFGMILGIRSLHEQRAVHRDIAVRNFLVNSDGRVLLCDFGLTEFLPDGQSFLKVPRPKKEKLPWRSLAPECFDNIFSTASDMYMYGLALIELVHGKHAFADYRRSDALINAMKTKTLALPDMDGVPAIVAEIARDCCQLEASARPTAAEVAERLAKSQFLAEEEKRDLDGNTPLHRLVLEGDAGWVRHRLRLKTPSMVNAVNYRGDTPLMLTKDIKMQFQLLDYRKIPSTNIEPSRDMQYFHNIDIFFNLLKMAEKENVQSIKSLVRLKQHDEAKELFAQYVDHEGQTPLHVAAMSGNAEVIDALISLNLIDEDQVNEEGQTALHVAARHGRGEAVKVLIAARKASKVKGGARKSLKSWVNAQDPRGKSALHLAAACGSVSATKALLSCQATDVNLRDANGETPIFDSVSKQNGSSATRLETLRVFLGDASTEVNAKDSNGETVLHKCARNGFNRAANALLQRADFKVFEQDERYGYTPLHLAVRESSFRVAEVLISNENVKINAIDKYGNTVFHILASLSEVTFPKLEQIRRFASMLVMRSDIDVNASDPYANTPLHVAARSNNVLVAKALLSNTGVRDGELNASKETPLHIAASHGSVEIATQLLSRSGVNANARDMEGETALHKATCAGSVAIVKMLISRDEVDATVVSYEQRTTALHYAASKNYLEIAEMLLSKAGIVADAKDDDQQTPLHLAAAANSVDVAKLLLSRDDVDASATGIKRRTPLQYAAENNSADVAKLLLARTDVDASIRDRDQNTLLHLASRDCNSIEVARMLVSRDDVDVNATNNYQCTPLHYSAVNNNVEISEILLSKDGIDAGVQDEYQNMPIHHAARCGGVEVAKMLLAMRDVSAALPDKYGRTPLHYAAWNDRVEVAKMLLLREDVVADVRGAFQETPLHFAAKFNRVEVGKMLLSRDDVDVNAANESGMTSLIMAASRKNVAFVKLLLSTSGVDVGARDNEGMSALDCAEKKCAAECVKLLRSVQAED